MSDIVDPARVAAFLRDHPVWDNHACMPLRSGDTGFMHELEATRAAGFSAVTINIGFGEFEPDLHLRMIATFRRWLSQHRDRYELIEAPGDVARIHAAGKLGISFDIEGARGVADELSLVQLYYDLGVRWMLIAYNRANLAGSGCFDEVDEGLTPYGRDLVAEMNRVGMTVCCSHTGERTAREALAASTRPVIFSHSNCAALTPHPRNISDDMIRACAATGGVVGINGIGDFLTIEGKDLTAAFIEHVDHAVQLVGPQHVGIALDHVYDVQELVDFLETMKDTFPGGLSPVFTQVGTQALPDIVAGLMARGYDDNALAAIFGGNWVRIAESNWRPATAMAA